MTTTHHLLRPLPLAACLLIGACSETPAPTGPPGAVQAVPGVLASSEAIRRHFQVGPLNVVVRRYLECIDEVVTIHNLGVVLVFDVVATSSGNRSIRASISWPDNLFFVERENGVRYFRPENSPPSRLHEFIGPVHFVSITDPMHLVAEDGSVLKFQNHIQVTFDDAGRPIDVNLTGACPNSPVAP